MAAIVEYSLAYKTATQAITTTPAAMVQGAELEDTIAAFAVGTSTTRHVVGAGYNGRYGRFGFSASLNTTSFKGETRKGGASHRGQGNQHANSLTSTQLGGRSAPQLLTTADYYEAYISRPSSTGTTQDNNYCWTELEIMPEWYAGAAVDKSAVQALAAATQTVLTFNQELHDIGAWHDTVTNNSRLTVPTGATLIRFRGNAATDVTNNGQAIIGMLKGGASVMGEFYADSDTAGTQRFLNAVTAPLAVTAGQYFELTFYMTVAGNQPGGDYTWAHIEQLPANLQYALVSKLATQNIATGAAQALTWNTENVDNGGWHESVINPSRFTVPVGVTHVRLACNISTASQTGRMSLSIMKNGVSFVGGGASNNDTGGTDNLNVHTAIIPVVAGDYFEAFASTSTARNVVNGNTTWFSIEEVKRTNIEVSPAVGGTGGGTAITILGGCFTGATGVTIDGNACTSFVVVDDETITCVSPVGSTGAKNIAIARPIGNIAVVQQFTYSSISPPSFVSITPNHGTTLGGTPVAIVGDDFTGVTNIQFDGTNATSIVIVDDEHITCVTPAGTQGLVDVEFFSTTGDTLAMDAFEYFIGIRITQVPIMVLDYSEQPIRITQVPILVLYQEKQPTRITQVPINVLYTPKPVPLPKPIVPETPLLESWIWKTSVSEAIQSQEQRARLREVPRYRLQMTAYTLDEADRVHIYNMLMRYLKVPFTYPLFQYHVGLDAAASTSDTKLFCDTTKTDIRAGEFVALYDPYLETVEYLTVSTVDLNGVNLTEPLESDAPSYYQVCPAFNFRIAPGVGLNMRNVDGDLSLVMESVNPREFQQPGAAPSLITIDDILIVPERYLASTGVAETFLHGAEWFDNETSIPEILNEWTNPHVSGSRLYRYDRRTTTDYWRAVCDELKGRQGVALFPTFRNDLPLRDPMVLNAATFTTTNINFYLWYQDLNYRYLAINTANGMKYRKVNAVEPHYDANGDPDYMTVTLASSTGNTAGDNTIQSISYMNLCRLNDDEIKLSHYELDTEIELTIRAVNQ